MARVAINTGASANDGLGDNLRAAGGILNNNFLELYTYLGAGSTTILSAPIWSSTNVGINTLSKVGIGTTNPRFALEVGAVGASGTTLFVNGDARVTGIVTIGPASITLNGITNIINVGTGITINGSTGIISATAIVLGGTTLTGAAVTFITAGSGISVNQGTGNVTITATGGGGSSQWVTTAAGIHTLSNVGIGTTNPTSALTVTGNGTFTGVVTATTFIGNLTGTATTATNAQGLTGTPDITVGVATASALKVSTGTTAATIDFGQSGSLQYSQPNVTLLSSYASGKVILTAESGIEMSRNNETVAYFAMNPSNIGYVELYYDNSKKFQTIGDGVSITGTTLTNQLSVSGVATASTLNVGTGGTIITTTTAGLVGIGTTNPTSKLTVSGNGTFTGVVTATTFVGNLTGTATTSTLATNAQGITGTPNLNVGIITATTFIGDGSGLTGVVGSGSGIVVKDSGSLVGTAGTIDFGDNLSVSAISAGVVTVTGSAGGGSSQFVTTAAGIHTLSNVGIGTTNPTSALTVTGNATFTGVVTATTFIGNLTGTATTATNAQGLTGTPNITVGLVTATTLNVGTGGTVITTTTTGLVGIGTTNPTSALTVGAVGSATTNLVVNGFAKIDQIVIKNNSNSYQDNIIMTQHPAGTFTGNRNVAIGDYSFTTPGAAGENVAIGYYALNVLGNNDIYNIYSGNTALGCFSGQSSTYTLRNTLIGYKSGQFITIGDTNTILGSYDGNQNGLDIRTSDGNVVLSDGDGNIRFYANSSGNVGLGTTNPTSKLTVSGDGTFTGVVTATTFVGNLTGTATTATGLSGTPNITVGVVTATTFVGALTGTATTATNAQGLTGTPNITVGIITTSSLRGYSALVGTASSTTTTFVVTVASKTTNHRYYGTGSGSAYVIDDIESPFITLLPGKIYRFNQENASNSSHPVRFYYDAARTTQYTTNVTTTGTPGSAGAYTEIVVTDTTPVVLHYQCSSHGYMGNAAHFSSNVVDTPYQITARSGLSVTGVSTLTSNVSVGGTISVDGAVKLITNNGTIVGTSGSTGEIKRIAGAPFFYDGSAWREFVLSTGTPVAVPADVTWNNVILRSTYDTNAPGFFDFKFSEHPIFTGVGATTVGSPVKIGTKSFRNNGAIGAGISYAYRSEHDFTGPWTIEFWINHDALPYNSSSYAESMVSQISLSNPANNWSFGVQYDGSNVEFYWYNEALATEKKLHEVSSSTFTNTFISTWKHYALVRESSNGSLHFYINGYEVGITTNNSIIDNDIISTNGAGLHIGGAFADLINSEGVNSASSIDAHFDDLRITTDARYVSVGNTTTLVVGIATTTTALPTTGTLSSYVQPPGDKYGEIVLGGSPTWRGTSGVTVSQQSSGNYRVSFASTYTNSNDYFVLSHTMDQGFASYVGIARSTTHVDFSINKESDNAVVNTGSLAVQIKNHP